MYTFSVTPFGNQALLIEGPKIIDRQLNQILVQIQQDLTHEYRGQIETVCTYQSLAVYSSDHSVLIQIKKSIENIDFNSYSTLSKKSRTVHIPVCYEKEFGLDLKKVAQHNDLSEEQVIDKHTDPNYYVYFIGFLPGFPYLGGLNDEISTPRLENPRSKIPKGSVGIANQQTGVYPSVSPGGWNIIGQTPVPLFDAEQGALLQSGDVVKFQAVSLKDFEKIANQVKNNNYNTVITHD